MREIGGKKRKRSDAGSNLLVINYCIKSQHQSVHCLSASQLVSKLLKFFMAGLNSNPELSFE